MAKISPITQRIIDLDPTLELHNEGEWSGTQSLFSAFNDAGVECEVGEFLYSITRLLKPANVLETGTHHGVGAMYIGHALKDNDKGVVDTHEFNPVNLDTARRHIQAQGLTESVKVLNTDVTKLVPNTTYQLIFLDTEPQLRFDELERFYYYLDEGGFIFIHDLHRHMHQLPNTDHGFAWPYGKIPKAMNNLVRTGRLRPFHFATPRGLTGFYKESKNDHYFEVYE